MNIYEIVTHNGMKTFSKPLSSIVIYSVPRNTISMLKEDFPGLYILFNENTIGQNFMYVGESENVRERLKQHDASFSKMFWTDTIIMASKELLNKAHYKHLENIAYNAGIFAGRFTVVNKVAPTKSKLSQKDEYLCEFFFSECKEILCEMRYYFFEHPLLGSTNENNNIYYLYHKFGTGKLMPLDESTFELLPGSLMLLSDDGIFNEEHRRNINIGKIKEYSGVKVGEVVESIKFDSANEAAGFVTNSADYDWTSWRNIDGYNLE